MQLEVLLEGASYLVRVKDPEDVSLLKTNPLRLLTAANGATSSFRVYQEDARTVTRTISITTGFYELASVRHLDVNDEVAVARPGLALRHHGTITGLVRANNTIALDASEPEAAPPGSRVWKALGDGTALSMAEYGSPAQGDLSWGFQGTFPADLAFLEVDSVLRVEALFVGAVGGNLERLLTRIVPFQEAAA
ncbi:MAG: hypothetical protein V3S03_08450 [Vicinamibacteria bacterium]